MSEKDNQHRYDDILKRIANRKPFGNQINNEPKSAYDLILDLLNAYDSFAPLPDQSYSSILCYGPKVIRKMTWSGVMVWYHNKGYYGYQNLKLFGLWVYHNDADISVTIGIRDLPYRASIYNAEGFHRSIHKNFNLFYEDDGHPPSVSDTCLFQTVYQQKERLTLRQTLQSMINQWKTEINSG